MNHRGGLVTCRFRLGHLALGMLVLPMHLVFAQASTGRIVGIVRDSAGRRIDQAKISAPSARVVESDSAGNFQMLAMPVGAVRLIALRIGYAPETVSVVVAAAVEAHAEFVMTSTAQTLPEEIVVADPLRGKMGSFNRRKARGVGAFVTRADIEKRQPNALSEMLRYLPGVSVTQRMAGEPQPVHMQRSVNSTMQSSCVVQLYVDGHPYPNGNVDDFSPNSVEGVEVYKSASEIPADFRTRDAMCGLISIWTRDPEAARRKP